MEYSIIIGLAGTALILLYAGIRQKDEHQRKEAQIRNTLLEKMTEVEQLETVLNTILELYREDIAGKAVLEEFYVLNACQVFITSPPELPREGYWEQLSRWYRKERNWMCEECQVDLSQDTRLLHTHHELGRGFNSPQHLKALCIACHSEVPGHNFKQDREYKRFIDKYGEQRHLNMETMRRLLEESHT